MRKVGDILLDMEPLLFELVCDHELQKGDIRAIISKWVDVHYPDAIEEYEDGSNPIDFYGPIELLKKYIKGS